MKVGTIRHRGRSYQVTDRLHLGGKTYLVLNAPLSRRRTKYCVFDRLAGPDGGLRAVHVLPQGRNTRQYVGVIRRITEGNVNLPRLIEYHAVRGAIYLVLDWIYGQSLAQLLATCRRDARRCPSAAEAFRLFRGFAHGLRHMHHKANFVHGDIRPENLLLARNPTRLALIDLGSSWRVEQTTSRSRGDGRSDFYAAPEVLQRQPFIDFRSDQFSATILLYELLTLELPYQGLGGKAGMDEYYAASLGKSYVAPSRLSWDRRRLSRSVWSQIDRIVRRGLSLSADGRYANARDWLEDIDRVHVELRQSPGPDLKHMVRNVVRWPARSR